MTRLVAAALLVLSMGQPGTPSGVTARDLDGHDWTLLAPGPNQFDLLFFMSSDCPIGDHYAPEIKRICKDYQPRGLRCFAVYPDDDVAAVKTHRHEVGYGASIPAVRDPEHALVKATGAQVTPQAVLYSAAGRVYSGRIDDFYVDAGRTRPKATQRDLRLALDATIAGKPVAHPETQAVGCFIPMP
jgi:hypothetical protein